VFLFSALAGTDERGGEFLLVGEYRFRYLIVKGLGLWYPMNVT
jgi:hypothetical protein